MEEHTCEGQKRVTRFPNWWAIRWERFLSQWMDENRLAQARAQVSSGHVLDLETFPGLIVARIRGESPEELYDVRILLTTFSNAEWQRVASALSTRRNYAMQLLKGEMPEDIEALFRTAGLTLLPAGLHDISVTCTCSAWLSACKHWSAALYALGTLIDRDPFLLFTLRGRPWEQFSQMLKQGPNVASPEALSEGLEPSDTLPFPADPKAFWRFDPAMETLVTQTEASSQEPASLALLEDLPLDDETIKQQLTKVYQRVSQQARALKKLKEN